MNIRKKVLSAMLASVLALGSAVYPTTINTAVSAQAADIDESQKTADGFEYTVEGDGVTITGYSGSETDLIIPEEIDGKPVTMIGWFAFRNHTVLKSVTIPGSVAEMDDLPFSGCSSLETINVDESNQNFASVDGVLFNKDKTELILCPEGKEGSYKIPDGVILIDYRAFHSCNALKSVMIPGSVTSIGRCFSECESLEEINVDESNYSFTSVDGVLFYINEAVFDGGLFNIYETTLHCYPAGKKDVSYKIPDCVIRIEGGAFDGCTALKSVTIPSSVTSIGQYLFSECKSLEAINIDESNQNFASVDGVLFSKDKTELILCPSGKGGSYKIPDGVTSIANRAFNMCNDLKSVTIPGSVTSIGAYNFKGIEESYEIPYESNGCASLETINVDESNQNFASTGGVLFNKDKTELILCPSGKGGFYKIPDGVTSIARNAFWLCDNLKSVTIPGSVTEIPGMLFYYSASLEAINVDESNQNVASVDGVLFDKDITELIRYPEGKKDVSYKVPDGVTIIRTGGTPQKSVVGGYGGSFCGCKALETVTIPSSVTKIGWDAFIGCSSLTMIRFTGTEEQWNDMAKIDLGLNSNVEVVFGEEPNDPENPDDTSSTTEEKTEFTPEPVTDETVDEDTKKVIAEIKVTAPEMAFEAGTVLTVKKNDTASGDKAYAIDITFTLNGAPVQPKDGAAVTVQIPVPPIFKNADESLLKVFHFLDGKYTKVEATVENGMVKFDTTHFSTYVISTEDLDGADSSSSGTSSEPSSNGNPSTGIAIALVPTILAGAAVAVIIRKRK